MKAVVLCAGQGARLGELTRERPKAMLPVAGKPLLQHHLEHLHKSGIRDVAINLHYLGDQIEAFFGDGRAFGVSIHYSREQTLLGTAGALIPLRDWLASEPDFLVQYGDILTDQPLAPLVDARRRHDAFAALLLHRRARSNSVVAMDPSGRIIAFLEQPTGAERAAVPPDPAGAWVNSCAQELSRAALDFVVERGAEDLPRDVYVPEHGRRRLQGVPLTSFRVAIDSPERLRQAEKVYTGRPLRGE